MKQISKVSVFTVTLATAFGLVACSSDDSTSPAPSSVEASITESPSLPGMGESVEAPGVTLTVLGVSQTTEVPLLEDGVKAEAAETEIQTALGGREYVTVNTEVENTGSASWDLTCGFAIQAILFDAGDHQYDPIKDLDRIPGNPECNSKLNPGLTDEMTWVYEVPSGLQLGKFGFADPETNYGDFTFINLTSTTGNKTKSSGTSQVETPASEASTQPSTEPAVAVPTIEHCIGDLTLDALYSDGSVRPAPSCENDPTVQRAARAEGVCGGMYGWTTVSAAEYRDLCGSNPPTERAQPATTAAPRPQATVTQTFDPNSADGYGPNQELPPFCVRFPDSENC